MPPDFSELPDVVWVQILAFLKLHDRANVSQTCHRLDSAFNHPSLWYSVTLDCSGEFDDKAQTINMSRQCKETINRFGKYVQDLHLKYDIYFHRKYYDARHNTLKLLGKNCRLQSLTLDINFFRIKQLQIKQTTELDGIVYLIQNCHQLRSLRVLSWLLHEYITAPKLFEVIQSNKKLKTLETVHLFWSGSSSSHWETMNTLIPSREETMDMLTMLTNLTVLKLRSSMISTRLVEELARSNRVPLKILSVLVTYSRLHSNKHTPDISTSAWCDLKRHSPDLKVDFSILNRVPLEALRTIFKADVPVASIQFLKYSECNAAVTSHVADFYCDTLRKFTDFGSPSCDMDATVVKLVETCEQLNYFVFSGKLHHHTIAYIAKLKGLQWQYFQINSENVITTEIQENNDDDVLIKRNDDGSVDIIRPPEVFQSDIERQGILEVMIHEVSEYLGRKWLPLDIYEKNHKRDKLK